VGKSAITIQFVQSRFVAEWDPTIEDQYKKSSVVNKEEVYLNIVDTAGQEEYRAMRPQYMRSSDGFLLVYDVTSRNTFEEIDMFHSEILQAKDMEHYPAVVLVGNKCDLEYERQVRTNEGRDLARRLGCQFFEVSTKFRENVDESFHALVIEIRNYNKKVEQGLPILPPAGSAAAQQSQLRPEEFEHDEDNAICCGSCVIC